MRRLPIALFLTLGATQAGGATVASDAALTAMRISAAPALKIETEPVPTAATQTVLRQAQITWAADPSRGTKQADPFIAATKQPFLSGFDDPAPFVQTASTSPSLANRTAAQPSATATTFLRPAEDTAVNLREIPLPASLSLLATGLVGLAALRRIRLQF